MQFPIIAILIIYFILLLFFILFSGFLVYHSLRFGVANLVNIFTLGLYLAVSAFILGSSYLYIISIDWSQKVPIF